MIVDASAMIAVLFREVGWERVLARLRETGPFLMSAANHAETLMVVDRSGRSDRAKVAALIDTADIQIRAVDTPQAEIAAEARGKYLLRFADCFCYALAKRTGEPILTLDAEFRKTDATIVPFD